MNGEWRWLLSWVAATAAFVATALLASAHRRYYGAEDLAGTVAGVALYGLVTGILSRLLWIRRSSTSSTGPLWSPWVLVIGVGAMLPSLVLHWGESPDRAHADRLAEACPQETARDRLRQPPAGLAYGLSDPGVAQGLTATFPRELRDQMTVVGVMRRRRQVGYVAFFPTDDSPVALQRRIDRVARTLAERGRSGSAPVRVRLGGTIWTRMTHPGYTEYAAGLGCHATSVAAEDDRTTRAIVRALSAPP